MSIFHMPSHTLSQLNLLSNNGNTCTIKAFKSSIRWFKQEHGGLKLNVSKTGVKSSAKNYFKESLSRKNTNGSYMLEGKRAKKMHTKCDKMHTLPEEIYPICI